MIQNALRLPREPKQQEFVELRAMETQGEPVRQGAFEIREGIEMVPGTVHLVDSEFLPILRRRRCVWKGLRRPTVPNPYDAASLHFLRAHC
jgi:hypothetical protein